jgi:hypothetical protein
MIKHKTFVSARAVALVLGATLFASGKAAADQVIPDDLIVQGSTCTGFDCVNNMAFNSDTLVLRENNLRIFFDDTSVLAGFPANKWRLTANDSASGGASFFSIDDATANRSVFKVTAGAPANSLFVSSTGNVGLGTAAPTLDLTITTSDTPAHRLEQTAAGGFTAQTWDIAGNEANFFVRDVTGGSRLPFRIRPGAPTSSIDIAANGSVGIGTASPAAKLHVSAPEALLQIESTGVDSVSDLFFRNDARSWRVRVNGASGDSFQIRDSSANAERLTIDTSGNIGIGTPSPAARLHTIGTVRFAGVTGCGGGIQSNASGDLSCIVSSRQFKNIAGDLPANVALANVMALRPQIGSYKETPDVPEHWLIAEEVAAVDPALIGLNDGKPYVVKTQNVVADLVAVVQQQQRQIEELKRLVAAK